MVNKKVLVIGIDPFLIDFTSAEFAASGLTAEKVEAGILGSVQKLNEKGFQAEHVWIDLGQTAGKVVEERLKQKPFDIAVIGAGIRVAEKNFLLFEELINVIHQFGGSQIRICFNTNPGNTVEAAERWSK